MSLSDDFQLLLSPSAFGAVIEVIIERIAPTISAPIATSPPPVILRRHALLSNVTFAVDGDMEPDSAQLDYVVCAIQEDTWLTTVRLHTFQSLRPPISLGLLQTPDRNSPRGVLIEREFECTKGVMLQSIFFPTVSIFSRSYAALIFCGDYTLTTGIIACTS
jgi:hypothetical protein